MQTVLLAAPDWPHSEADFDPGGERAPLLMHGKSFDREGWAATARSLSAPALLAMVPDFRSYGNSRAAEARDGRAPDVAGACAAARQRDASSTWVGGAFVETVAAAKAIVEDTTDEMDALVPIARRQMTRPEALPARRLHCVVSRHKDCCDDVAGFHDATSDPKELLVFPGVAPAQALFRTNHGTELFARPRSVLKDAC